MKTNKIHIAVFEPNEGSDRSGGFEWRLNKADAEKEYRDFRGHGGTAYLFNDVEVNIDTSGEIITDWIDELVWTTLPSTWFKHFGLPVKIHSRS